VEVLFLLDLFFFGVAVLAALAEEDLVVFFVSVPADCGMASEVEKTVSRKRKKPFFMSTKGRNR
jgi:hypothetical protein